MELVQTLAIRYNAITGAGSTSPDVINATNGALIPIDPIPLTGETGTLPTGASISIPYGSSITVNGNVPIHGISGTQNSILFPSLTSYDWNISIPWHNGQTPSPSIVAVSYDDIMLCRNGSLPLGFAATDAGTPTEPPYTYFAVDINTTHSTFGQILWMQTYNPPAGNLSLSQGPSRLPERCLHYNYPETIQWQGYSLTNGNLLWTTPTEATFDYYGNTGTPNLAGSTAYGNLYSSSFSGILYCYNDLTGTLEWTYGNGGAGNSTYAGLNTSYGDYPTFI